MASASIKANLMVVLDSSDAAFDGASGYGLTATRPLTVIDAFTRRTAAPAGGTVTVRDGTNAIFTALTLGGADGDLTRASAGYNATNAAVAVGDSLNMIASVGTIRAVTYINVIPGAIS